MRRERAPIADSIASAIAGGAVAQRQRDQFGGDAVEQRHPRLLRQQQDVLEREQPRRGSPRGRARRTARDPA